MFDNIKLSIYDSHIEWLNNTTKDINIILKDILKDLDCSKTIKGVPIIKINSFRYKNLINKYIYYNLRETNQFVYNNNMLMLESLHKANEGVIIVNSDQVKTKLVTSSKKRVANKFIKSQTRDLFSGEIIYNYYNPKTKEEINSSDPNLLEELNATKKKVKKVKTVSNINFILDFNKMK